jgi:hypothetical protein
MLSGLRPGACPAGWAGAIFSASANVENVSLPDDPY